MPKTTFVIILNWNGKHMLDACLTSALRHGQKHVHVLLVDNGSSDGSLGFVQKHFPQVSTLDIKRNLGFALGNNLGIRYALDAGADYVALLNNDTRVDEYWLSALMDAMDSDPSIAICEARQYTWDGTHVICLRLRPDWLEGEAHLIPPGTNRQAVPTGYAAGCCMLIRSTALAEIGVFDPRYFAYVEDVDLSLRAWIAGYKVVSVPTAVVYHRVGMSASSLQQMRWGYRNQLYTLLKDYERSTMVQFRHSILRRWVLTRNRYALNATLQVCRDMSQTLVLRSEVQRTRRRTDKEIFDIAGMTMPCA